MGRPTRAFCAALALHALAATWLGLLPPPTATATASRTIELEWALPVHVASPAAPDERVEHPADGQMRRAAAPVALRPRVTRAPALTRPAAATTVATTAEPLRAVPPTDTRAPAQLFPHGLLEQLAAQPASDPPARDRERETPGSALDDAAAETRTRAGRVDPIWRDLERELAQNFHPPVDVVHDAPAGRLARALDRLDTYVAQQVAVVEGGEERLRHPVDPDSHGLRFSAASDVGQQGFTGASEGLNLRSMPLSQQQAVLAATGDPARWLAVELELTVDGAGRVTRSRVVMPSGRRAFDREALRQVAERVARAAPPASISRWVCRAGYAASRPDAIGVNLDLAMLVDKQLRKQLSLQYPLQARLETRIALKWVKTAP